MHRLVALLTRIPPHAEICHFWNVLKGEISIVQKRPKKKAVKMESTMLDKRRQTKITTVIVTARIGDHWSHLLENHHQLQNQQHWKRIDECRHTATKRDCSIAHKQVKSKNRGEQRSQLGSQG